MMILKAISVSFVLMILLAVLACWSAAKTNAQKFGSWVILVSGIITLIYFIIGG